METAPPCSPKPVASWTSSTQTIAFCLHQSTTLPTSRLGPHWWPLPSTTRTALAPSAATSLNWAGEFWVNQTCGRLVPRAMNGLPLASSSCVPLVWKPPDWALAGVLATATTLMDTSSAERAATAVESLTFIGTSHGSVTGRADVVSPCLPAWLPWHRYLAAPPRRAQPIAKHLNG